MTRLVILQSSYIPWKGYFDLINDADLFVFYDDVQYTKNDWRNRNKIKTAQGALWLSVPVGSKINRRIHEVDITSSQWQSKHLALFTQNYSRSQYFKEYLHLLEKLYVKTVWKSLSELNQYATRIIAESLGIKTTFLDSRSFETDGSKLDRLLSLIMKTGADTYISGPSAKTYIDEDRFKQEGISLIWKDYSGYPAYPQRFPPFEHAVSVLDLLFNVGPRAPYYIWGWRGEKSA
jgi:hypothetical protein